MIARRHNLGGATLELIYDFQRMYWRTYTPYRYRIASNIVAAARQVVETFGR